MMISYCTQSCEKALSLSLLTHAMNARQIMMIQVALTLSRNSLYITYNISKRVFYKKKMLSVFLVSFLIIA
jgi:hypothetical protein